MNEKKVIKERFNNEETKQDKEYFLKDIEKCIKDLWMELENEKEKINYAIIGDYYKEEERPNTEIIYFADSIEETYRVKRLIAEIEDVNKDAKKIKELEDLGIWIYHHEDAEITKTIPIIHNLRVIEFKEV